MFAVEVVWSAYLVFVGLVAGSFINLVADRLPRGESVITPRSRCRACGRRLNAVDLLPVAGYLVRRGRCASCGTAIGFSSPVVEAISAACLAGPVFAAGVWPGVALGLVLVAAWGAGVISLAAWRRGVAESPL